jgi:hypothetical protein
MTGSPDYRSPEASSLRELPKSIEPPHDLWPRIEAQLSDSASATATGAMPARSRGTRLRWLAAAAMVGCVAVGVWIGRSLLPGLPGGPTGPAGAANQLMPDLNRTAFDVAYVSNPRYAQERAALVRSLEARLAALPPPARAKVMASLATIEQAKADLEQALGRDPGNALLQELLVNTYQDEMRVLTDVHEASDSGRGT